MKRGRTLSDFGKGDTVMTPSGRFARVCGVEGDAVVIKTADDGEEMTMLPHKLEIVAPAPRKPFPRGYFGGEGVEKAMKG